jgi:chromatin modification-related protein VID21
MHDTHIQLHKLPKLTPAELGRQKAEREAAQLVEIQKARARQEEMAASGKPVQRLAGIPVSKVFPRYFDGSNDPI